jgi:hypothetical protein
MALFAFFVATVFATLLRETPREQIRFGARVFAGLVFGAYACGWAMFLVFR